MLVILYKDDVNGKRYPGIFVLLNNKKMKVIILYLKQLEILVL